MSRKRIRHIAALIAMTLTMAAIAMAAESENWARVQALREGDRIGVIRTDQKRFEGVFAGATETSLAIGGGPQVTVWKDDVVRIYRRPRVGRFTRTLIGAAIGVAAGAAVNATLGERLRNEGVNVEAAAAYAGGAAVGAGIGALTAGGYETVYRRAAPLATPTK